MSLTPSTATRNGLLSSLGIKEQLDAGFLFIFSGALPANADAALNTVTTHTELVKISLNSTATGLTFSTPTGGVLSKPGGDVWSGLCAFSGFNAATTQTPVFFRLCAAGDNGRGAANTTTGYRIQGTVGGPSSGADLQLGTATLTDGNTQPIGSASLSVD